MARAVMGRPYTGAATVYSSPRLELSRLRKAGYFTKGAEVSGSWTWSNGDAVRITTVSKGGEVHMVLSYTWRDPYTGKPEEIRQRIDLVSKPANLGRGKLLYFRCPSTGRLCRILYRAYHARTFRSRWGFSYRLYYPGQVSGKLDRCNTRYWDIERHIEGMRGKRRQETYQGKPTKRAERRERLLSEWERVDELRFSPASWPKRLQAVLRGGL
jgi:hypothetical protein